MFRDCIYIFFLKSRKKLVSNNRYFFFFISEGNIRWFYGVIFIICVFIYFGNFIF